MTYLPLASVVTGGTTAPPRDLGAADTVAPATGAPAWSTTVPETATVAGAMTSPLMLKGTLVVQRTSSTSPASGSMLLWLMNSATMKSLIGTLDLQRASKRRPTAILIGVPAGTRYDSLW